MEGASRTIKRVTLELGGKSANVDLRRRRSGEGRLVGARRRLWERRPGLLRAVADPCAEIRLRAFHPAAHRRDQTIQGRGPRGRGHRHGSAHLRFASKAGGFVRGRQDDVQGHGSLRSWLLVPVHAGRGEQLRPRRPRGGVRSGGGDHPVRGRGGGDPHRQRHAVRAVGLGLDSRRRARDEGGTRDRHRRAVAQLEHVGAGGDAVWRLQAIGLRARARACTRWTATPSSRTCSCRRRPSDGTDSTARSP